MNDACDVAKKCETRGEESPNVSPGTRTSLENSHVICIFRIKFAIRYASKNTGIHWLYCSKSRIGKKQNFVPIHCFLLHNLF